jgi:hypothetical protein
VDSPTHVGNAALKQIVIIGSPAPHKNIKLILEMADRFAAVGVPVAGSADARVYNVGETLAGPTSIQQTETGAAPRAQRLPQLPPRRCELHTSDPQVGACNSQAAYAYCLILGRPADDGELSDWVEGRRAGKTGTQLLDGMMQSEKVWQQYSLAELSDVNFVIRMYQLHLGRMPDGRGLSDYVNQIHRGSISRDQLIRELIASDEFRAKHPIFIELSRGRPAVQRECDLHI